MIAADQGLFCLVSVVLITHCKEHGSLKKDLDEVWRIKAVVEATLKVHSVACLGATDDYAFTLGE